jgi:lipoic acid synthetase
MDDLRANDVNILTLGQYLQPSPNHLPIVRYVHPDEFAKLKEEGLKRGFSHVESAPLVRSSYHAHEQTNSAHAAIAADSEEVGFNREISSGACSSGM